METYEFKVGDRVKVIGSRGFWPSRVGKTGVITTSINTGYPYYVKFDDQSLDDDGGYSGDLKLLETHKFSVGDKVRIVKRLPNNVSGSEKGWHEPNGNVGQIAYILQIQGSVHRLGMGSRYFGLFEEEELEVLPQTATEAVMANWIPNINNFHRCFSPLPSVWSYQPLTSPLIKPDSLPRLFKRKESTMNSIFQAIKAKLSPVDKTLVKHNYLNSDGTRSSMYDEQLQQIAMRKLIDAEDTADFRAELAAELKEDKE